MFVGSIKLQTNDETQALRFDDIEKYRDGHGYTCTLIVRSRWLSFERRFFFDDRFLPGFIEGMEAMDRGQPGQVSLKGTWETDELNLEMCRKGHVIISGQVTEHSELGQELRFALRTDQTVLGPLIRDLKELYKAQA